MTRFDFSIAVLACSLATSSIAAPAHLRYSLTPLDPSLTESTQVTDLNNRGEVVGNDGTGRAFLWNGQLVDLGTVLDPQSPVSRANAINDRSDIVGTYLDALGVTHNFLLQRGELIMIRVIGDSPANPSDINDRRQVVGTAFDAQFMNHGFIWRRGEAELLEAPSGNTLGGIVAVNDRGVAAGAGVVGDTTRAVIWKMGEALFVGPESTRAVAINNREQVLVELEFLPGVTSIWQDGELKPLPALSGSLGTMIARDINNRGQVVGLSSMPDGTSTATLWQDDIAIDLNGRIDSTDPLRPFVRLAAAFLINDRRQIVAFGPDSRASDGHFRFYLLTPVH
jgi:probable HAF family extracellular repeat protein